MVMKNRVNRIIVMLMAAAMVLPAMAQWNSAEHTTATAPAVSFQSTSTMPSSGSTYSSTPMWSNDGTAAYDDASSAQAQAPSGPRKVGPPTPGGDPTPIGDGVWGLILMAAGFGMYKSRMRRKETA